MTQRVLVAEDEQPIREVIRAILEDAGYQIATAGDGQAALDVLAADRFDLVLSDMMMPRLDGLGLARAMRDDPRLRDTPIILMSALRTAEGATVPHAAFLPKPFDLGDLLDTVERVLSPATDG